MGQSGMWDCMKGRQMYVRGSRRQGVEVLWNQGMDAMKVMRAHRDLGEVHTIVGWEAEGRARSGKEKQLFSSCPQSVCVCWFAISCPRLHDSWQKSWLVPMWLKNLHPVFCDKCLSLCCVCVLFLPFFSIFEHLLCSGTDCTRNIEWIT